MFRLSLYSFCFVAAENNISDIIDFLILDAVFTTIKGIPCTQICKHAKGAAV